jgi:hypothetical protein
MTTLKEEEAMIKRIQKATEISFSRWRLQIINGTGEDVFNRMDEVICKTQIADEIFTGMKNFESAMYITVGDYDTILQNLIYVIDERHDILNHIYKAMKESPDYMCVDRAILIEQIWEAYAEDKEVF